MSNKKALSAKHFLDKEFHLVGLQEEWLKKFGDAEVGFSIIMYGPSGSGKSVEVLRFANYFANNHGKVMYNSCEEGISKSIQDRIKQFNCDSNKLYFYDNLTYQEMIHKAKVGRYQMVVIDSAQYMGFTYADYQDFVKRFKGKKSLIVVSQVNGQNKVRGGERILHAVDIKVNIIHGRAHIRSRYLKGHQTITLFTGSGAQSELFNQS